MNFKSGTYDLRKRDGTYSFTEERDEEEEECFTKIKLPTKDDFPFSQNKSEEVAYAMICTNEFTHYMTEQQLIIGRRQSYLSLEHEIPFMEIEGNRFNVLYCV